MKLLLFGVTCMSIRKQTVVRFIALLFFCQTTWQLAFTADGKPDAADKKGKFIGENTYNNPALSMTITLPGAWKFFEKDAQEKMGVRDKEEHKPNPDCHGPFCGGTEIDVALISAELAPRGAIFLIAYKLTPEFLDRRRYSLKRFADAMATNSIGDSGWIISGDLTATQLDKRPAYRLLVHKPVLGGEGQGFGYVAESNGYVFLLVGTVPNLLPGYAKDLQAALESMKLTSVDPNK
jgi:hypothetical protein